MDSFRSGLIDVLISTTIVGSGIDIPSANSVFVLNAHLFGLSQLYQIKGRVGRGSSESFCILIADPQGTAAERIEVFMRTSDGFVLAKEDLRIRGQGDFFGAQQHGRDPVLKFADLTRDEDLLVEAQYRARSLIQDTPDLDGTNGERVKELLSSRYNERMRLFSVG